MKVSIHQPQYFPWAPYFTKIEESDLFVFLDTVDFQKNGLQNRNQIKTPHGAHWLTVPVRQRLGQKIIDVEIDNTSNWRRKHWHTIRQFYSKASSFNFFEKNLQEFFDTEWCSLSRLNIETTLALMRLMAINTPVSKASELNVVGNSSDLILNICTAVGATQYISGVGGLNYLNEAAFSAAGVEIVYLPPRLPRVYPQQWIDVGFINNLSVIDLLLNCGNDWKAYMFQEMDG